MTQAWDEFMRSPQFLENMRQWMDSVTGWRQLTNNALARARHELQGTAREDIDALILAMRHMERRILERQDDLEARLAELQRQLANVQPSGNRRPTPRRAQARSKSRSSSVAPVASSAQKSEAAITFNPTAA